MAARNHSIATVGSRHPVHGIAEFADAAARDAHEYAATDVGKIVQTGTGSGRRYWMVYNVEGGLASVREVAPGTIAFGSPVALSIGGSNSDGVAVTAARSDHTHALPAPKLDDLAAPDDNTDLNASTLKHGLMAKLTGSTTDFWRADGTFAVPPGTTPAKWNPDLPPTSPHACDDEMLGGAVDAKWGTWDPGSVVSAWSMDTTRKMLQAQSTTSAGQRVAGRYQAIPHSEFTIYTKPSLLTDIDYATDTNQWVSAGLLVAGNIAGSPTTAPFFTAGLQYVTSSGLQFGQSWAWSNYTTLGTNVERAGQFIYYRLRVNGIACFAECSCDGQSWLLIRSGNLGFTPAYLGLQLTHYNNTVGINVQPRWQFFRCFSGAGSSAYNATSIGRYA